MATSKATQPAKSTKPAHKATQPPPRAAVRKPKAPVVPAKTGKATVTTLRPAAAKPTGMAPHGHAVRPVARPAVRPMAKKATPENKFSEKDLEIFRRELLALRDRLTGQVGKMRQDALRRDDEVNTEEDGTDAFDRLFTLERAGSDQEIIFRINESLRAIEENTYGVCENCSGLIEKPRLQALPFAKNCVTCQSEMERSRNGNHIRRHIP
jgi:RNA polymerase-binding transcription factor DksA